MRQRWIFFVRMVGALVLAVGGYSAGTALVNTEPIQDWSAAQSAVVVSLLLGVSFALFGFAAGYLLTPLLLRPLDAVYNELRGVPPTRLTGAVIGMSIGLLLGTLLAFPLSFLPAPFGSFFPVISAVAFAYIGTATVGSNPRAYLGVLSHILGSDNAGVSGRYVLLDTSVIIDGRIADVAETGFIDRTMLVPRFVLAELQQVADSADALRRNRGRRGLEVLNRLQNSDAAQLEISDMDEPSTNEVDRKLVALGKRLNCAVMTNDYNLNRVAEIEGVKVLNLNELANSVKTMMLPGETFPLRIIQAGKEAGQGVGYLEDGTMVVVEEGRDLVGSEVEVQVSRVLQTVAGRMIFAGLATESDEARAEGGPESRRASADASGGGNSAGNRAVSSAAGGGGGGGSDGHDADAGASRAPADTSKEKRR